MGGKKKESELRRIKYSEMFPSFYYLRGSDSCQHTDSTVPWKTDFCLSSNFIFSWEAGKENVWAIDRCILDILDHVHTFLLPCKYWPSNVVRFPSCQLLPGRRRPRALTSGDPGSWQIVLWPVQESVHSIDKSEVLSDFKDSGATCQQIRFNIGKTIGVPCRWMETLGKLLFLYRKLSPYTLKCLAHW